MTFAASKVERSSSFGGVPGPSEDYTGHGTRSEGTEKREKESIP